MACDAATGIMQQTWKKHELLAEQLPKARIKTVEQAIFPDPVKHPNSQGPSSYSEGHNKKKSDTNMNLSR